MATGNQLGNNGGRMYSFGAQPVLIDCSVVVNKANTSGTASVKGAGVQKVFMYSTAGGSATAIGNPLTVSAQSQGYALIQLNSNYNRYLGGFSGAVSPLTGGNVNIDATDAALTIGKPYVITSAGHGPAGTVTIAPVADVSGSLAGKYFMLYDSYGNNFCIWFNVSGVGMQPLLGPPAIGAVNGQPAGVRGLKYVQQTIATNASAATIGAALVLTIQNLDSGVQGVKSFTASGTTTVTVVSTAFLPVAGIPQDGSTVVPAIGPAIPVIFTIASGSATAGSVWTDGSGHLYTVTTTVSSGTTLVTSGIGQPVGSSLTFVSGAGSTTALSFSSAAAGYATGFSFALTVSDTNLADWNAVGLPRGLTPTAGQSFVATATGAGGSTGTVKAVGVSGILSVEVVGDPNLSFAPMPQGGSPNVGAWLLVQFMGLPSSGQTPVLTQPADGSVIGFSFYVDARLSPSNVSTGAI